MNDLHSKYFDNLNASHATSHELSQQGIDVVDQFLEKNMDSFAPAPWARDHNTKELLPNRYFVCRATPLAVPGQYNMMSALYGPMAGDEPIYNNDERVRSLHRSYWNGTEHVPREGATLVIDRKLYSWRPATHMAIIGLVHIVHGTLIAGGSVFTIYGHSHSEVSPKEPSDPHLTDAERDGAVAYWAEHKLAHSFE